jgi:hypothetical protein
MKARRQGTALMTNASMTPTAIETILFVLVLKKGFEQG